MVRYDSIKSDDVIKYLAIVPFLLFFFALFNETHGKILNYYEYHCYYGWSKGTTEPKCNGDGSSISMTHYIINVENKTVAINDHNQSIIVKEKNYYYNNFDYEIWTMCEIVDEKNFKCLKSNRKNIKDEIYQLSEGKVIFCTYCVRYKNISAFEYFFITNIRKVTHQYCDKDQNKCPSS